MNRGMCGNNTTPSGSGDEPSARARSRPWENCLFLLRPPSPHILFNHMGSQAKSQQQRQCPTAKYCVDVICTSDQNLRMCNLHNEECVFIIRLSDVKSIDNVSYFELKSFRLTRRTRVYGSICRRHNYGFLASKNDHEAVNGIGPSIVRAKRCSTQNLCNYM